MTLRQKQSKFIGLLAILISWVYDQGWEMTLGDGLRKDEKGHMPGSLHYTGLAQDLNLFVDEEWISDGGDPTWTAIGVKWESLDPLCRWGGRFKDSNHFSIAHDGKA